MDCAGQSLTPLSARRELPPSPWYLLRDEGRGSVDTRGVGSGCERDERKGENPLHSCCRRGRCIGQAERGARGCPVPVPVLRSPGRPGGPPPARGAVPGSSRTGAAGGRALPSSHCPCWHQPRWPHAAGSSASPRTPQRTAPPPLHPRVLWVPFRGSCPIGSSCLCLCFISGCL